MDTARIHRDHRQDHHPHACTEGLVFLAYTVHDDEVGEEVERIEVVPCRRCAISSEDDRYDHDIDELII
jgi:hypothetical protein